MIPHVRTDPPWSGNPRDGKLYAHPLNPGTMLTFDRTGLEHCETLFRTFEGSEFTWAGRVFDVVKVL